MTRFKFLRSIFSAVVFVAAAFCVYAGISFENPSLNSLNKVLFSVRHDIRGTPVYSTALLGDAASLSTARILTCYPEKMELLSRGSVLQIRNRWGTARWNIADQSLSWITRTDGIPSLSECQTPQSASPDGKWICYIKKSGICAGDLVLRNASTLQEVVLAKDSPVSYRKVPVAWSQDSACVLYEKEGAVYFCEPKAAFQKIQLSEDYRKIGDGTISSVCWANSKTLFYINRDLVYKINANELYTRGLYSQMVGSGVVNGRLPFMFNPLHDSFSVNTKADSIVLVQSGKIVSLFMIGGAGFEYLETVYSRPVTDPSGTIIDIKTFWTSVSRCVLWIDTLGFEDGVKKSAVYNLGSGMTFLAIMTDAGEPALSADGKRLCYSQDKSLFVYDIDTWKLIGRLDDEKVCSYLWNGSNVIFAGGESTVREWTLGKDGEKGSSKVLFLSASANVFWNSDVAVCAEDAVQKNVFYDYDMASGRWSRRQVAPEGIEKYVQNGRYRVFTGETPNQKYTNTLYVRTLSGKAVTRPYFPETAVKSDSLRRVSIAVDALDDASGLSSVLYTLKKYNVPAVFFVNGEFIRRYPKETRQIAKSGFDCGSMFFTNADLTAKGFVIDEDFIRRGLGRNEDEFFQATGSELNLIWHTPMYKSTQPIKDAGANCGYRYIEAGRFSLDTVTLEDAAAGKPGYLSASELVKFYVQNATDGSVIPVSTGISTGTRSDYLYEKLDLLISSLLNEEFEVVSLKNLQP